METKPKSGVMSSSDEKDYEELVSALPTATECIFQMPIKKYEGFWFHSPTLVGLLQAQKHFVAQPDDIIVCSFPKAGTTWLKALTFATATRAQFDVQSSSHPLLINTPHHCTPFLEDDVERILTSRQTFRVLSSHAPSNLLPDSIRSTPCKILYIWRDPKDVLISALYFGSGMMTGAELDTNTVPVVEAFDQFCRGIFPYGPYWDHAIGFLNAVEEQPDKFLCYRYEDIKADTAGCVRRLAEFISQPFSTEEEEKGVVNKIVELCSFDSLRKSESTTEGEFRSAKGHLIVRNELFYRRGKVGDWKNHLTQEMASRLDTIFQEKFADAGLRY